MVVSITAFRDVAAGETLLNTVSGINAVGGPATVNLYTVPAGQTVVVTKVVLRVTAIDTLTVPPEAGVGIAAGEDDIFFPQTVTGLTAVGDTWTFDSAAKAVDAAAAEIIKLGFDTLATATTLTLAADIFGYFVGTVSPAGAPTWQTFTPTGTWTNGNVTYSGVYRIVGDTMDCMIVLDLVGEPNTAGLELDLPPGYAVDGSKVPGANYSFWPMGSVVVHDAGTAVHHGRVFYAESTAKIIPTMLQPAGSLLNGNPVPTNQITQDYPVVTWGNGGTDQIFVNFTVPVVAV